MIEKRIGKTNLVSVVLLSVLFTVLMTFTVSGAGGGEAEETPPPRIETDLSEISTQASQSPLGSNTSLQVQIDEILDEKPVFLFFYADWCHFCHQQMSIIDELEKIYAEKLAFIRIN